MTTTGTGQILSDLFCCCCCVVCDALGIVRCVLVKASREIEAHIHSQSSTPSRRQRAIGKHTEHTSKYRTHGKQSADVAESVAKLLQIHFDIFAFQPAISTTAESGWGGWRHQKKSFNRQWFVGEALRSRLIRLLTEHFLFSSPWRYADNNVVVVDGKINAEQKKTRAESQRVIKTSHSFPRRGIFIFGFCFVHT